MTRLGPMKSWTCFHCDETFDTREEAQEHFGLCECELPACVEKLTEGEKAILQDRKEWRRRALVAEDTVEARDLVLNAWQNVTGLQDPWTAKCWIEELEGLVLAAEARLAAARGAHSRFVSQAGQGSDLSELKRILHYEQDVPDLPLEDKKRILRK